MKCKLSEKCEFGNLCKDATRHDSLTCCSSFKTKKPMTNVEYIRSCSTSELAVLLYKIGFYSNITDDVMNTALMENIPTEEAFELWLKEIHND